MITSFLQNVRIEVVPSKDLASRLLRQYQPPASLSVAALPRHDISTTIEQAIALSAEGYRVTAHLPARAYQTEDQLRRDLDRLQTGCVSDLLVVSGDPRNTCPAYSSSAELAAAIEQNSEGQFRLGVAGYPEGHPVTGVDMASLQAKQKYASSLVTQMCFDPKVVADYSGRLRHAAINLPMWVGVPGPVSRMRLMGLAKTVGVTTSLSQLGKLPGMAKELFSASRFDPLPFIASLADTEQSRSNYAGLHIFSFNDFSTLSQLNESLHGLLQETYMK